MEGASTRSTAVTIHVTSGSIPANVVFQASPDHATMVSSYRLDVFPSGIDPNTGTPMASSDLGIAAADASGDITVDRSSFFSALPSGTYVATVSAVGASGQSRSAPVTFTR
jgi:hypothetical protein